MLKVLSVVNSTELIGGDMFDKHWERSRFIYASTGVTSYQAMSISYSSYPIKSATSQEYVMLSALKLLYITGGSSLIK